MKADRIVYYGLEETSANNRESVCIVIGSYNGWTDSYVILNSENGSIGRTG
jgi:hypothetical protein